MELRAHGALRERGRDAPLAECVEAGAPERARATSPIEARGGQAGGDEELKLKEEELKGNSSGGGRTVDGGVRLVSCCIWWLLP